MNNRWILAALTAFASSQVLAQTPVTPIVTKDWVLEDLGATCLAHTQRVIETQTYRLEMQIDKSAQFPVEIFIREVTEPGRSKFAQFVYDKSKAMNYYFSPITDGAGNVSLYQVPRGGANLVSYLKRGNSFNIEMVAADLTVRKVDFSLRGSSATIDNMIAKCNSKKELTSIDFEKNFFDMQKLMAINPANLRPDQVARLRSAYLAGHQAYTARAAKQAELEALTNKYLKQIRELDRVKGNLDNLTQKELATLNNRKAALEAKITSLEQSIAAKQAEIQNKEQELLSKNAAYDAAWQKLVPHKAEHDRLQSSLGAAQSSLNSWNERLDQIDSGIRSQQSEISDLQAEADRLRRDSGTVDSQLSRAQREFNDAESELRRFDPRRELQERLRRMPGYESDKRELERLERELPLSEREVQWSERERDQRRRELEQCQATPNANCAGAQAAFDQANQRAAQADQQVRQMRFQLQSARQQVEFAERRAEQEVRDIENRLRQNENETRRQFADLQNQKNRLESRARDIVNFEIPNRQNSINSLRGERPAVVSNINSWSTEVVSRRQVYNDFKVAVGWDAKKLSVDTAAGDVTRVKRELQKLEDEKAVFAAELARQKKLLSGVMKEIEAVLVKIEQTEGKSAELQAILKPYFEGKLVLEAQITSFGQRFESSKLAYNSELGA